MRVLMDRRRPDRWEVDTQPDLIACTPEALNALARGVPAELVEEVMRAMQMAEGEMRR